MRSVYSRLSSRLPSWTRTLRFRLVGQIVTVSAVALLIVALVAVNSSQNQSNERLSSAVAKEAAGVDAQVRADWEVSKTLAAGLSNRTSLSDTDVVTMLRSVAESSPQLVGIYAGWASNKFPGVWRAVPGNC